MDATLAKPEESAGRKIHPRLFHLHGGRLRRVPRLLPRAGGIRIAVQTRYQAILSDGNWILHSGTDTSQSHKLCGYRFGEERHFRHPPIAISFPVGRERTADVG